MDFWTTRDKKKSKRSEIKTFFRFLLKFLIAYNYKKKA